MLVPSCERSAQRATDFRGLFGLERSRGSASLQARSQERYRGDEEEAMGFGRGALLWLLGVPLPIILLLALFWHH
jgi:hypothetical protein